MSRFTTLATVSLMAMGLATHAFAGTLTTFATTTDTTGNDIVWTNNGTSATLNTANTTTGSLVTFQYANLPGLPTILNGPLNAYELINGGAGVSTTTPDVNVGGYNIQQISAPFSISYTLATPIVSGGVSLSNLLTATITPASQQVLIGGQNGNNAATLSASSGTNYVVTFTTDFLKFTAGSTYSLSFAFNSLLPGVSDGSDGFLNSFTADLVNSFSANPAPTSIPEVPSAALLIIGMAAVGVSARRRAAAAASV
jgi:hypothetical protein